VFVDTSGHLHLRAALREGRWWCAEVIGTEVWGLRRVQWVVTSPAADLGDTGVLGLFSWSDDPDHANREVDVEVSRWGTLPLPVLSWTVHPTGDQARMDVPADGAPAVHELAWRSSGLGFAVHGVREAAWSVDAVVPVGDARPRMNVWLFGGQPPSGRDEIEVVITDAQFDAS
jgi:hypothetical protein